MSDALTSVVVSGLVLGSLYALMASGLSLIWSTLKVFNFAHGAFMTLGAYLAWTIADRYDLPIVPTALLAIVLIVLASFVFGAAFVRPFTGRPQADLLVMVTTLAAMTITTSVIQLVWGSRIKQLPTLISGDLRVGEVVIGPNQLVAIVLAPVAVLGLVAMLRFTRLGIAIRAVGQNRDYARLVGIRPARIYAATVGMSAALAALAGILLGGIVFVTPTMGDDPLLKAFVVVIFGGLASVLGSLVGAYALGFLEAASVYWIGLFWTPVVIFGAMILVMLARPEGLIGRRAHS